MRILVVSQYFWPENFRVNDLVEGLIERGHEVAVLTGKPNYPGGSFFPGYGFFKPLRERYAGAEVLRAPLIARRSGRGTALAINYASFVLLAGLFGPLLCRGRFDIVFVYEPSPITVGLPAILMKKIKGAPLIFWVQDLWPESLSATGAVRSERVLGWVAKVVRYIYRHCDRVLVTARSFGPRVEAVGAAPEKVYYWPQWAEGVYRPVELGADSPEQDEVPKGFRVVFAGNIGAAQSFGTILDAADKLRKYEEIRWIVFGDGRQRKWAEERARELGLGDRVRLLGSRPMQSMPRYFSIADALLVTLKKDPIFSLTIPAKIQSYLACGRPIVGALDGEGARVVQEAGAGLTVPAQDAEALAAAVLKLYETPAEEREEMGRRGRAYFEEHFERERLLDRMEEWMEELTGGKK